MTGQTYKKLKEKWKRERLAKEKQAKKMKTVLLKKGVPVFKRFGIQKVVLFGSVADNRSGERSDIDLLVIPLSAESFWNCRRELEQELDFPIDLYTQDDDQTFINKILQRGEVIYEVQPGIIESRRA